MMRRRCLIIGMAFAFGMILLAPSAWATCEQQDLEGTWNVEVWGGALPGGQCWDKCTLTISSGGNIQQAGTYIDCLGVSSQITGGYLTISSNCLIEGEIYTTNGTLYISSGAMTGQDSLCLGTEQ